MCLFAVQIYLSMIQKVLTASTKGISTQLIQVEIDICPSLPQMIIVGLPDKAVQESKERIRSAIKESGFEVPLGKITVNLAPSGVTKSGTNFDLPIALGILKQSGFIIDKPEFNFGKMLFLGELSLDGLVQSVRGTLSICLWAKSQGYDKVFVPFANRIEASLVSGLKIIGVNSLSEIVDCLNTKKEFEIIPYKPIKLDNQKATDELLPNDFAYIKGQAMAKRALEIAAAGGHNVMLIGEPGSGKTLLARSYPNILPAMTEPEILEATQIHSVAGTLEENQVITTRPFRAPHHSCSHISLVGGGSNLRPGEISLSHRGVLFLDEFPEFKRESLEVLRQPLEDGFIQISRAIGSVIYPSKFYLIAAANPTPSGFNTGDSRNKNPQNSSRYLAKFSGPIMDRIDLHVEVNRPQTVELQSVSLAETSNSVAIRVQNARNLQTQRFNNSTTQTNSEMTLPQLQQYCVLDFASTTLMTNAINKLNLSARSYNRILKLARTIADLDNNSLIQTTHLAEALQFRPKI